MDLIKLLTPGHLIVDIDISIIQLAEILSLPINIDTADDHLFIDTTAQRTFKELTSFGFITSQDERVSTEVFSEILIDIASGMTVKAAYEKQGFTFY